MSWGRGVGALCQGDVQRALPLLERALSICHTADLPGFVPRVAPTLGAASYPQFLLLSVLGYAEGMKPLYPSYDHPLNTGTEYEQSGR
jgi:hypothetical protein